MIVKLYSPQVSKSLEQIKPAEDKNLPGLIIDAKEIAKINPVLLAPFGISAAESKTNAAIFVQPKHVPFIYQNYEDLSAIKSLVGLGLSQIDSRLKAGVDIVWVAIGTSKLISDWKNGTIETSDIILKTTGLAFDAAGIAGAISPGLKIPDTFMEPAKFVFQTGKTLYSGDEIKPMEMFPKTGAEPVDTIYKGIAGVIKILDPKTDSSGISVKPLTLPK